MKKLPRGAKICNRCSINGGLSTDDVHERVKDIITIGESWRPHISGEVVQIGVPRNPASFLEEAIRAGHPSDFLARSSVEVPVLMKSFAKINLEIRFAKRATFMKKWLKRSLEFKQAEEDLHRRLDGHLKPVLRGKRLLLWREILQDLGYPDVQVVDQIISGFLLTGWAAKTNIFEGHVGRPTLSTLSLEQLERMSSGLNAAVVGSLKKDQWSDVDDRQSMG